jgi:hydrogenase maturation protease
MELDLKILILGIGNVLFTDEGIGVHLANLIDAKYQFLSDEHSIDIVDGGTLAQRLIPIIVEYDYVIIIDCLDVDDSKIGDVYFFDFDNMPNTISWQGSAHEIEMLQTLNMIDLYGDRPITKILGVIPERIEDTRVGLSNRLLEVSKLMEKSLIDSLKELRIECKVIKEIDINYSLSLFQESTSK